MSIMPSTKKAEYEGLDFKPILYLDRVHTSVIPATLVAVSKFLQNHFHEYTTYVDVTALTRLEDIIALLDFGAAKVFVSYHQLKEIVEDRLLEDLSRLIVSLDHSSCEGIPAQVAQDIKDDLIDIVGLAQVVVHIHDVHEWKLLDTMHEYSTQGFYPARYVSLSYNTRDNYVRAAKCGHIPIVPASALTVEPKRFPHLVPAELLITTSISSDRPDKLYPTVVTNEHGLCLGLVYSNAASVHASLRLGKGVYKSRKRDGMWIKGETSGDTQELVSVSWDCDGDCLRFCVRQKGNGFCHLKASTCFGPYTGLMKLEQTLQQRKKEALSGSHTSSFTIRCLNNPDFLKAKIMEEAEELCNAETTRKLQLRRQMLYTCNDKMRRSWS